MLRRITKLLVAVVAAAVLVLAFAPAPALAEAMDTTDTDIVGTTDEDPSGEEPSGEEPSGEEPEPVHEPGWAFEDDVWRYFDADGTMLTSAWLTEEDTWYYFDADGAMLTNTWLNDEDGAWYYFDADGLSVSDTWVKTNGKWYYVGSGRTAVSNEWVRYDNSWYYIKSNGNPLVNGWATYEGSYYYFGSNGKLLWNSWVQYKGKYYYLGSNGKPLVAQQIKYKGTYYYFGEDGYCTASSSTAFGTSLNALIKACRTTPTTGVHKCAAWVTYVFMNAGIGHFMGNANQMCDFWCYSSDLSELKPGMIIAVTSTGGSYASRTYGHVGIYLGNGIVAHNYCGVVGTMSLYDWWVEFGDLMTPRWGWMGGIVLK